MNHTATMEKMRRMKLHGMLEAFQKSKETGKLSTRMTPDELFGYLVDAEWEDRQSRKLRRMVRKAKFRYHQGFETIDFSMKRTLDKDLVMRLKGCDWIKKSRNLIITGKTGAGKSHLASALGHEACLQDYSVLYFNCMKLFRMLKQAQADHSYGREIRKIQKANLLILDDFGLQAFDAKERMSLLEILEDRQGNGSTIVVSQIPVKKWHELIGDSTIADAVCDRLIHSAFRLDMDAEDSARKMQKLD